MAYDDFLAARFKTSPEEEARLKEQPRPSRSPGYRITVRDGMFAAANLTIDFAWFLRRRGLLSATSKEFT